MKREPFAGAHSYDELRALLIGQAYVRYDKIDYDKWGFDSGIDSATLRRRLQAPEKITLGELRDMARPLGISGDELRAVLPL